MKCVGEPECGAGPLAAATQSHGSSLAVPWQPLYLVNDHRKICEGSDDGVAWGRSYLATYLERVRSQSARMVKEPWFIVQH